MAGKLAWHHGCKSHIIKISNHSVVLNRKAHSILLKQIRIFDLPHNVEKQILGGDGVHLPESIETQCFLLKTHKVRSWSSVLTAWESKVVQHPVTKIMEEHEFHVFRDVPQVQA